MEVKYRQEIEIECPHCKKKSLHYIEGEIDIEPPDLDGSDY